MIYNDFPILNNDEYKLLESKYSSNNLLDRKTEVIKIFHSLTICKNSSSHISQQLNHQILKAIQSTHSTLTKILENFSATFSIPSSINESNIYTFNLFQFLKKLTSIVEQLNEWQAKEDKEYYKNFINISNKELLNEINNILSQIEKSNIYLFKFM